MSFRKIVCPALFAALLLAALPGAGQTRSYLRYSQLFETFHYRGPISVVAGPGIAVYSGDLCNTWACNRLRSGFGLGVVSPFFPRTSIGAELRYFHLASGDVFPDRNNSFTSRNYELTAFAMFHILDPYRTGPNQKPRTFDPYITLGVGVLQYNPTSYNAAGEKNIPERSYPGYAPLVPVGIGSGFRISDHVGLAADLNYRYAFSDYIDDTSAMRGKSERNDGYILLNLKAKFTPNPKGVKKKNPYK